MRPSPSRAGRGDDTADDGAELREQQPVPLEEVDGPVAVDEEAGDGEQHADHEGFPRAPPRGRSHFRFRNRGTDYTSESGINWMSCGTKRQCDRALTPPRNEDRGDNVHDLPEPEITVLVC
jgi:hypothetical protein